MQGMGDGQEAAGVAEQAGVFEAPVDRVAVEAAFGIMRRLQIVAMQRGQQRQAMAAGEGEQIEGIGGEMGMEQGGASLFDQAVQCRSDAKGAQAIASDRMGRGCATGPGGGSGESPIGRWAAQADGDWLVTL